MPKHTSPDRQVSELEGNVRRLAYRVNYLPTQLENAYRKLDALEKEARLLGMSDLIRNKKAQTNDNLCQSHS